MNSATSEDPSTTAQETVLDYLTARGVFAHAWADRDSVRITELTGGVSGEAILVEAPSHRVVVKRALGRLRVRDEWRANPGRAVTEAAAIEVLHAMTPSHTPELLDIDPTRFTLVMTAADARWTPWKARLLTEQLDPALEIGVGRRLGSVLGTWHRDSGQNGGLAARFADYEGFEQLRIAPFHRVVARRHPDVADAIQTCIADLETRRDCLVHGDYSPKNVLVGPADTTGPGGRDGLMVLDFEVACYGAAVFDAAYLQCHLLLKAVHRPAERQLFRRVGEAFLAAYLATVGSEPEPRLGWHTACVLLARVDGTSPSGYLDPAGEDRIRRLARHVLGIDDPSIGDVWDTAMESIQQAAGQEHEAR